MGMLEDLQARAARVRAGKATADDYAPRDMQAEEKQRHDSNPSGPSTEHFNPAATQEVEDSFKGALGK